MLNERAWQLCDKLEADAEPLQIAVERSSSGARLFDCGIRTAGTVEAGRRLAQICLAGLGEVSIVPGDDAVFAGDAVFVESEQPVAACMASQYAGWKIAAGKFFAMGSGPMRAAAGKEAIFQRVGHCEQPAVAVGVLETRDFPPSDLQLELARACRVEPPNLTLLVAPTASPAGTLQIVARSLETALHKLLELGFDLNRVRSGWGRAPLPPVAADDLAAIGRTNDAILYGGEVTLWVDAPDDELESIGPQVPSNASRDHGRKFATLFKAYNHDFYRIDPHLFSPAMIVLTSLSSGRTFRYGQFMPQILRESFGET
jgi:methenyltetrahydromethanopterin cyclohydrolase